MSYRLSMAAEADVTETAQWYNERQAGLGEKFLREIDQAIVRILENPLAFPVILRRHEVRRGPWQNQEIQALLSQFVKRQCPVIPTVLPSAKASRTCLGC
jgi:hypothetical protein